MQIRRALISVYDKRGIVKFAKELHKLGIEIIATEGTARFLKINGIPVKKVSDVTDFPEILDGRVKTLHPKIAGGILALREKEEHMKELKKHGIRPIDIVVSNLYPFEETISKESVELKDALENIDVGGPNMIRAAAKNFENVVVIVNPERYEEVLDELRENGEVSEKTRARLATEAFEYTAKYDWLVHKFLERESLAFGNFPEILNLRFHKIQDLIYGENPHQKAAFYKDPYVKEPCVANAEQLHGRKLSWTNILDLNVAIEIVKEFDEPTVTIIKHENPCGVACASSLVEAYEKAYASDPISAFGGVVGCNREIDFETGRLMAKAHFDCIIAPVYDARAFELLKKRKVLRLLKLGELRHESNKDLDMVKVRGGLLVQEHNSFPLRRLKVVTEVKPTKKQIESLKFAWKVVKYVKSNGIVLAQNKETVGIGMSQPSRVDAVRIAIERAGRRARGSVLASDGFFPFRDSIDEAAKAGIKAIIQPGGSIRDKEVIQAANEHGISMIFTGIRAFRH